MSEDERGVQQAASLAELVYASARPSATTTARTGRCKGKAILLEDFAPEQAVAPAHARSAIQPLLDLRLLNRDPEGKEATRRVLHYVSRGSLGRTNGVYV